MVLQRWLVTCFLLSLSSCEHKNRSATQAGASSESTALPSTTAIAIRPSNVLKPPLETFSLEPWQPPRRDVKAVSPPESLLEEWRVFVTQTQPRQKRNPRWRALPPKEAVVLEMAEDGSYRCVVNPLQIQAQPDEALSKVEAWTLSRDLLCSADGWKTWMRFPHQVIVLADGTKTRPLEQTTAILKERINGKVRETLVFLRSDQDRNTTRTGPPTVIDAPQHVD